MPVSRTLKSVSEYSLSSKSSSDELAGEEGEKDDDVERSFGSLDEQKFRSQHHVQVGLIAGRTSPTVRR